jgi:N-methylhydantoinase A
VTWNVRYAGQAFELPIAAAGDAGLEILREKFEQAHRERYGYADPDGTLEVVNLRVTATTARSRPAETGSGSPGPARRTSRSADFEGREVDTLVLSGPPDAGERLPGPAVLELEEATVIVPPGWIATSDQHGAVLLDRDEDR